MGFFTGFTCSIGVQFVQTGNLRIDTYRLKTLHLPCSLPPRDSAAKIIHASMIGIIFNLILVAFDKMSPR